MNHTAFPNGFAANTGILILLKSKLAGLINQVWLIRQQSKLKTGVVLLAGFIFWISMFRIFLGVFNFLSSFPDLSNWLADYLFALFFFALGIMLIISNAIIIYSSLYKSRESEFLLSLPLKPSHIFLYKLLDTAVLSSWAFLFLGTPLMLAYGVVQKTPFLFYPLCLLFFIVFIIIPSALGALIAMGLGTFFPRQKKHIVLSVIGLAVLLILIILPQLAKLKGLGIPFTARWMQEFLEQLSFCQNPVLPSYWMVQGIVGSAHGELSKTIFFFLMLLANGLFLMLLAYRFAGRWYRTGYSLIQSWRRNKKYPQQNLLDRLIPLVFFFFKKHTQLLIIKDIKNFSRDTVQWSQFLIFFGLLAVYFLNINNLPYINLNERFWQYLVSLLNFTATSLTLATFTSRFVYPQISLEGRCFWILGMVPAPRQTIFYGKFLFSLSGSFGVSLILIGISNWMVKVPILFTLFQFYLVLIICLGLSALSVGLGTIYPNLREDNPSKIVSGFGGTLNLILSLCFVLTVIILESIPCHYYFTIKTLSFNSFLFWLALATFGVTLIGIVAAALPLYFGARAIKRLEI